MKYFEIQRFWSPDTPDLLDSRSLSLSPLRGIVGVTFIATPEELVSSLNEFATSL